MVDKGHAEDGGGVEGYWGGRRREGVGYNWDIEGLLRHGRGSTEDVH